jgi:hypothetical protein
MTTKYAHGDRAIAIIEEGFANNNVAFDFIQGGYCEYLIENSNSKFVTTNLVNNFEIVVIPFGVNNEHITSVSGGSLYANISQWVKFADERFLYVNDAYASLDDRDVFLRVAFDMVEDCDDNGVSYWTPEMWVLNDNHGLSINEIEIILDDFIDQCYTNRGDIRDDLLEIEFIYESLLT